jgi:hypothetical protein
VAVVLFVVITAVAGVVLFVGGRWLLTRSEDQDHVPRSDEVHLAIAPRGEGA